MTASSRDWYWASRRALARAGGSASAAAGTTTTLTPATEPGGGSGRTTRQTPGDAEAVGRAVRATQRRQGARHPPPRCTSACVPERRWRRRHARLRPDGRPLPGLGRWVRVGCHLDRPVDHLRTQARLADESCGVRSGPGSPRRSGAWWPRSRCCFAVLAGGGFGESQVWLLQMGGVCSFGGDDAGSRVA